MKKVSLNFNASSNIIFRLTTLEALRLYTWIENNFVIQVLSRGKDFLPKVLELDTIEVHLLALGFPDIMKRSKAIDITMIFGFASVAFDVFYDEFLEVSYNSYKTDSFSIKSQYTSLMEAIESMKQDKRRIHAEEPLNKVL